MLVDVLVDEAPLVDLTHGGDDADGEPQEAFQLHERAK
jgi:hypothetical protein